jgi:hypothetical protein
VGLGFGSCFETIESASVVDMIARDGRAPGLIQRARL